MNLLHRYYTESPTEPADGKSAAHEKPADVRSAVRGKPNAVNFNQRTVAGLDPPAEGHKLYSDKSIRGFWVRVHSSGKRFFVFGYTNQQGQQRRITIGKFPEISADAARTEALALHARVRAGEDPLETRDEARQQENPTIADLSKEYFAKHATLDRKRPASIRNDKTNFTHVTAMMGDTLVSKITKSDIEELHQSFKATPYTANRILSLLSKAFSLAMEWGWRTDNPVRGVRKFSEYRRQLWLKVEELDRLLNTLDSYPDKGAANAIRLLVYTGSRPGEVFSARWEDFDLERGSWTKPSHHTKTKRVEHVTLGAAVLDVLKEMRKESTGEGWIFPSNSETGHIYDLKSQWKVIRALAKLPPKTTPYTLRHTYISHLVSGGVPLVIVGKNVGHTTTAITLGYAHLADEPQRAAANLFGEMLRKPVQK